MPEDVPSLQRSSSFYHPEERTVAIETFKSILMRKIAQLPSDDLTMACDITIIFFTVGIPVLLFSVLAWLAK